MRGVMRPVPPVKRPGRLAGGNLAIVCSHFNFAGFKNSRRNLMRFLNQQRAFKHAVYGIEVHLDGERPVTAGIPGWWQEKVSSRGVLWQRDAVINELARRVPKEYMALAWVDTDIWFENLHWMEDAHGCFEKGAQVLQLFEECNWDEKGDGGVSYRVSSKMCRCHHPAGDKFMDNGHTGFAWAATRDMWTLGGGLFSKAAVGSADMLFANAVQPQNCLEHPNTVKFLERPFHHDRTHALYEAWRDRLRAWAGGNTGYIPGNIWHEWHGAKKDRANPQKINITNMLRHDYIVQKPSGIVEWAEDVPQELIQMVADYFTGRKEDG